MIHIAVNLLCFRCGVSDLTSVCLCSFTFEMFMSVQGRTRTGRDPRNRDFGGIKVCDSR